MTGPKVEATAWTPQAGKSSPLHFGITQINKNVWRLISSLMTNSELLPIKQILISTGRVDKSRTISLIINAQGRFPLGSAPSLVTGTKIPSDK